MPGVQKISALIHASGAVKELRLKRGKVILCQLRFPRFHAAIGGPGRFSKRRYEKRLAKFFMAVTISSIALCIPSLYTPLSGVSALFLFS